MMLTIMGLNINAQWTAVNTGLTFLTGSSLSYRDINALATSGTSIFAGTDTAGVYLSTNNGSTWTAINNGLSNHHVHTLAVSGTNIFAGTEGGMFLSSNNGGSWVAVNNGLTALSIKALAISGTSIYAAGTGVFLSTNNGSNWTAVNNGLTDVDPGGSTYTLGFHSLAVSGANSYAGTYANALKNGIFLSVNNGSSWSATGFTGNAWSMATNGTTLFSVGVTNRVNMSSDNGNTWSYATIGSASTQAYALLINGAKLFVGATGGQVYLSTDNGITWSAVNTGLPPSSVLSFVVSGTNIYAGTESSGIWKRPLSELVGIEENNSNINFAIYPNPNNGMFTISGTKISSIEIFNMLGERVYKSEIKNSDSEIDLSKQQKGIYFVQIMDENKNSINKKVVIH